MKPSYKRKDWVEWLQSKEKRHIHTFRDDVVNIAKQVVEEIYWIHGINRASFVYNDSDLHIDMFFDDTNIHVIIPFALISDKCNQLNPSASQDIVEEVRKGTKKTILEAIAMK